jgi:hypothetical protein
LQRHGWPYDVDESPVVESVQPWFEFQATVSLYQNANAAFRIGNPYGPSALLSPWEWGILPMDADKYRHRARRCVFVARHTTCPKERARVVDVAMMWIQLAEWAAGKWPGTEQQFQQETPGKRADS